MSKDDKENDEDGEVFEVRPSDLDERTHNELLMLYEECANSIRFAKSQQWHTLGASLLTLLGVLLVAHLAGRRAEAYMNVSIILCTLIAAGSIYIMIAYQLRQNAERQKIKEISHHFSNLLRRVRSITPTWEERFYRYTLLLFMISAVLMITAMTIYYLKLRFY